MLRTPIFMAVMLLVAACSQAPVPSPPATDERLTPGPAELAVSIGPNGNLVGYGGLTLYTFDNDAPGVSNCVNDCLFNWPPLLVASAEDIPLGDGLDPADFATIARDDGALQVTFQGKPLYFYQEDTAPGDELGSGLDELWHIVSYD